jgi:hypothetical protein
MNTLTNEIKVYSITENGFSMIDDKVSVPACRVKATSYIDAVAILNKFLATRIKPDSIELITPMERIDFDNQ